MTRPVADYTPCEKCGHPLALHSERGCHVITEMRAAQRKPNETCGCTGGATINAEEPSGEAIADAIDDAMKKVHEGARVYQPSVRDEKTFLVERQQQWVKEQRQ